MSKTNYCSWMDFRQKNVSQGGDPNLKIQVHYIQKKRIEKTKPLQKDRNS